MLNASASFPQVEPVATPAATTDAPKPHVSDFISMIARLAQVLAEEADALDKTQIRKVGEMQEEKLRLTSMLEKFKKFYDKYPGELEAIAAADREDLQSVIAIFDNILRQNHRRLLVARELNRKMVDAIREAVTEASTNRLYNTKGGAHLVQRERLSVTLNEII